MTASRPSFALSSLSGGYFAVGVSSLAVIGLAAPISRDLGVRPADVAQLVTLFALTYALAAPLLQMVVGGWDRRVLILAGLAALAAGALMGAAAPGFGWLAVSRIVMALGSALVGPMASAAGAGLVAPERRAAALGAVFTGMTLATVLGVPLASWLGALLGWRLVLVATAALSLTVATAVLASVPSGLRGERTTAASLRRVLTDATVAPAIGATLLQMGAQFVTYALVGTWLVAGQFLDVALLPLALFVFGVGGVVGNAVASRLAARASVDRLIVASLLALAAVFAALGILHGGSVVTLALLGLWAVVGMLMMAPQQARLVQLAPDARNIVLALNAAALYLGMAGGAALGAAVLSGAGAGALPFVSALVTLAAFGSHLASARAGAARSTLAPAG